MKRTDLLLLEDCVRGEGVQVSVNLFGVIKSGAGQVRLAGVGGRERSLWSQSNNLYLGHNIWESCVSLTQAAAHQSSPRSPRRHCRFPSCRSPPSKG